jgi:hypothetical protein
LGLRRVAVHTAEAARLRYAIESVDYGMGSLRRASCSLGCTVAGNSLESMGTPTLQADLGPLRARRSARNVYLICN